MQRHAQSKNLGYAARMALTDQELWGAASMVLRQHGELAPVFVAERIGALALEGDAASVAVWQKIARKLEQLRNGAKQ